MEQLEQTIQEWIRDANTGQRIEETYKLLRSLEAELFSKYEPQAGPRPEFWQRFASWIGNVADDEDKKRLLLLASHIFFIGREEYESLYRVAYNNVFGRWLIDQTSTTFTDPNARHNLHRAAAATWICPISDSMRINAFYHVNRISGFDFRPDWRSMAKFGSVAQIDAYISDNRIERLVLVEDFVGSGSQMEDAVAFAATLQSGTLPILVIPLVICPEGERRAQSLHTSYPQTTFEPVLRIRPTDLMIDAPTPGEPADFPELRDLAQRTYPQVCGGVGVTVGKPYSPFGYLRTGALIVMYSNCPDNTLPMIHHQSALWNPLFPRATRV
jgi:hypothetical protein